MLVTCCKVWSMLAAESGRAENPLDILVLKTSTHWPTQLLRAWFEKLQSHGRLFWGFIEQLRDHDCNLILMLWRTWDKWRRRFQSGPGHRPTFHYALPGTPFRSFALPWVVLPSW
jgi:hypothetical protein